MPITYLQGDATVPQVKGPKLIVHISNTLGGWGAGFVLAISRRWSEPEMAYRSWYHHRKDQDVYGEPKDFKLGAIQVVQVKHDTWVVNMIAQEGMKTGSKGPPIRYDALRTCLSKVSLVATEKKASIHAPRIGCGLAGGRWEMVEPIIQQSLRDLDVFVYDYGR